VLHNLEGINSGKDAPGQEPQSENR
jgi:hypothetical protein